MKKEDERLGKGRRLKKGDVRKEYERVWEKEIEKGM